LSQRALLILGLALVAAGLLVGGVAAPILEGANPAATNGPMRPGDQFGPGFPGSGPGGGFKGGPGHHLPWRMAPSPQPSVTPNL
jgi:hypothetical protein